MVTTRNSLTQALIDRVEPPMRGQRFLRDDQVRGLALRVTATGAAAFIWEGRWRPRPSTPTAPRLRSRKCRITLGQPPAMSLGLARLRALEHATTAAAGDDPRGDRRTELTFGELATRYLSDHAKPMKRSWAEDARMLRDVLPRAPGDTRVLAPAPIPATWRARRLSDLSRNDLAQLHTRLGARGPYQANRVLALLRSLFAKARLWGLYQGDNPAHGLQRYREQSRERFLDDDELQRVLVAIYAEPDPRWKAFFLCSLLLASRKSELLAAKWTDMDLDGAIWQKPMTKAGKSHRLPLPRSVVAILEAMPRAAGSPWIFPSALAASGHLETPGKAWARLRARAQVPDVRVHDLRRTTGSWLAASGHSLPLIGKVLGHTQPAATAIYARLDVEPVRKALEANARLMLGPGPSAP